MRGVYDRFTAGVLTLAFMAIVRPDPNPSLIGVSLVAILMYEGIYRSIRYIRRINRRRWKEQYILATAEDIRRWAETWLKWPLKEVS